MIIVEDAPAEEEDDLDFEIPDDDETKAITAANNAQTATIQNQTEKERRMANATNEWERQQIEATMKQEEEDEELTLEECKEIFHQMLVERDVSTKSSWEKELPKIVFDPRYKLLPQQALRRRAFDNYVKTRGQEKKDA